MAEPSPRPDGEEEKQLKNESITSYSQFAEQMK